MMKIENPSRPPFMDIIRITEGPYDCEDCHKRVTELNCFAWRYFLSKDDGFKRYSSRMSVCNDCMRQYKKAIEKTLNKMKRTKK